jgi:5-methylcytosine-specific restriction protein A
MVDVLGLSNVLTERFGVPITGDAQSESEGLRLHFRPSDLPPTIGFSVSVLIGWRNVEVKFVPGTFGRQIFSVMANATAEMRFNFKAFVQSAIAAGAQVVFAIDGVECGVLSSDIWPKNWRSVVFEFLKSPIAIDAANKELVEGLALEWSSRMLGAVLSLLPLEAIDESDAGEAEGGGYQVLRTRYERSALNRQACIQLNGCICKVCGFSFGEFYGPVGEGFIEVHHVEPLAGLSPGTVLDPALDLVPLCSNCHSMAHKRYPVPYSVDELKGMIVSRESLFSSSPESKLPKAPHSLGQTGT